MKKNKLNLSLDYKVTSHLQAHLQFAQANARPKIAKELVSLQPEQNYFLKFPSLLNFFKTATAQAILKTAKPKADKAYRNSTVRTPAGNTGLAKVAVQCSADTFVVNQSLVLRINICSENRHLRQARKRCASF
jgi:hypothetical protein